MGIITGKKPGPRRLLAYAAHGVGKSTFASHAPNPLFLDIEEGTHDLDVARWDQPITSYMAFVSVLEWVRHQQHDYQTLVIDTIDWLEKLIFQDIATQAGVVSVADIDFGKGYPRSIPKWSFILNTLEIIQRQRRMGIVLLSHARIEKVANPEGTQYDRYAPDLWTNARNEGVGNMVQEWCSEVFFLRKKRFVRTEGKGFNEHGVVVGSEEREMLTSDTAYASAKNRLNMPTAVPMLWSEYTKYILANKPSAPPVVSGADIGGFVVEGSSKPKGDHEMTKELAEVF